MGAALSSSVYLRLGGDGDWTWSVGSTFVGRSGVGRGWKWNDGGGHLRWSQTTKTRLILLVQTGGLEDVAEIVLVVSREGFNWDACPFVGALVGVVCARRLWCGRSKSQVLKSGSN